MPKCSNAIERQHECFARQCIDEVAQHVDTLDAHVADECERQMNVGVNDCPAAGARGNVTSQRTKRCLRASFSCSR